MRSRWPGFGNTGGVNFGQVTNGGFRFKGQLDEARVENLARSSNWIWAAWMTSGANNAFQSYANVVSQPPGLQVDPDWITGLRLVWPATAVGFTLLMATNLVEPVAWMPVTNLPVFTNQQWQVALPIERAANFYRLQSP